MMIRTTLSRLGALLIFLVLSQGIVACAGTDDPIDSDDAGHGDADVVDIDARGDSDPDARGDADAHGDADPDAGGDADSDPPGDADTDLPDAGGECVDGATRCGMTNVEHCVGGEWQVDTTCSLGCEDGECSATDATCEPDTTRCYRSSVQRCNREGTAWLHDEICLESCDQGLCEGTCEPGEFRCNQDIRESCDGTGTDWSTEETCALGCQSTVCVTPELEIPGTIVELSGTHVYEDCVELSLGGVLRVPAGEKLEIHARCLTISESSSIEIGAGARLRAHIVEDVLIEGSITGGDEASIESLDTLVLSGNLQSSRSILRADSLSIEQGASTSGSSLNAALYGDHFSNEGSHSGIVSVMPPTPIESSTHPGEFTWNLSGDDVVVTWNRPFSGAAGYYVAVGDDVPGPGQATFRTTESIALPLSQFEPGENRVRIVSVNADSEVGTFFEELVIDFNARPPRVSSTSHPESDVWGGTDDVHLSWSDPSDVDDDSLTGYFYVWDRQADTLPVPSNGTFDDRNSLLLADQDPGVWFFHIVNIDRMGRTSPLVGRYRVQIGAQPATGNIAGTITDSDTGEPIRGATVLLNGGLERTRSGSTGDYTFAGTVLAAADPYRVSVRAVGYQSEEELVQVDAGSAQIQDFALAPDPTFDQTLINLGWEIFIRDVAPVSPSVAMGPAGRFIWATTAQAGGSEDLSIHHTNGELIHRESTLDQYQHHPPTRLGWQGNEFYAIDNYRCGYDDQLSPGHGWSCLQMRTWDRTGSILNGWLRWRNSGQTSSASVAFNGSTYGTFFISYHTMYFRELTEALAFADGESPTQHTTMSSGHYDSRASSITNTLWDGTGYATAWIIGRTDDDSTSTLFFGRWDSSLEELQAPIEIDPVRVSHDIGLQWDGTRYHLLYFLQDGSASSLVMRTIEHDGTVSPPTLISDEPDWREGLSLESDGDHLILAWTPEGSDRTHLEVRSVEDHSLIETHEVDGVRPRLSINPEIGAGVLLYQYNDQTWSRSVELY